MALAHFQRTFTDVFGNVQPGLSVEVRRESDGALAALFSDAEGNAALSNPFTTDTSGYGNFYAADGRYRVRAASAGIDWRNFDLISQPETSEAINQRTIFVGSVAELEAFPGPTEGQEAIVSGAPYKFDGADWIPSSAVSVWGYGAEPGRVVDCLAAFDAATEAAHNASAALVIPGGDYRFTGTWTIPYSYLRVIPEGKVTLHFENSGDCVVIDGTTAEGSVRDTHFGQPSNPIWISGNADTNRTMLIKSVSRSSVSMWGWNCDRVFETDFAVLNDFYIRARGDRFEDQVKVPIYGLYLGGESNANTAGNNFWNPVLESLSDSLGVGTGIYLKHTNRNKFFGGTSEGNKNGVTSTINAQHDVFYGLYCEANTGDFHFYLNGRHITIYDIYAGAVAPVPSKYVVFGPNSFDCRMFGGITPVIEVQAGAERTQLIGVANGSSNMNINDSGTNTTIIQGTKAAEFPFGAVLGSGEPLTEYDTGSQEVTAVPGTSGSITLEPGANSVSWVKVGRLVTITGRLRVDSVSSPSGTVRIEGLPFTASSSTSHYAAGCVEVNFLDSATSGSLQAFISPSSDTMVISKLENGARAGFADELSSASELTVSISYLSS